MKKYKPLIFGMLTVVLMTILLTGLVGCYGKETLLTVPNTFTKIEDMENLYYAKSENNLVYYLNYSWSGYQGYGIMNEWICGENDKPYHYNANTGELYTLED